MKILRTPLSEEDVRGLRIGETVSLTGPVITGRDEMHMRAIRLAREGEEVPEQIRGAALYHCGPIMVKAGSGWKAVAAGPTTSARMDSLEPEMIRRFGIRAIIGKGGMSDEVAEAMRECGCVYLAATGGAAIIYAEDLAECQGCEWPDLGMPEAMWKFNARNFGPLVVAIDSTGDSLYKKVSESLVRGF